MLAEHAAAVLALGAPLPAEVIPADVAALGRILSADVTSLVDLPPWDNSAMDGYALRHADLTRGADAHEPAMGGTGTDIAMETADVVIMNDDLRRLAETVRLSRRTHAVLWQNITLALGIKAVFFVLAVFGDATMWMAVFADMGASLLVVGNGLRMLRPEPASAQVPRA